MKLTGAAILDSRGMRVLQAVPAAYPCRSARGNSMGLDIHAASHLRYAGPLPEGAEEFDRLLEQLEERGVPLHDFDGRYFELAPNAPGSAARLGGMEPGLYEYSQASEQFSFHVGSFGSYGLWRAQLCRLGLGVEPAAVGRSPERFAGGAFVELVLFTDCDGRIGTRVAAKLAADFRAQAGRAEAFATTEDGGEWFLTLYREFARAFELAAQDGAVQFG
jgi:hypothetical protein